jgi:hypothetical protein
MEGRCKFFHRDKLFGFIAIDDEYGQPIGDTHCFFFHGNSVVGGVMPERNEIVDFWLDDAKRPRPGEPWQAVEVTLRRTNANTNLEQKQIVSAESY